MMMIMKRKKLRRMLILNKIRMELNKVRLAQIKKVSRINLLMHLKVSFERLLKVSLSTASNIYANTNAIFIVHNTYYYRINI